LDLPFYIQEPFYVRFVKVLFRYHGENSFPSLRINVVNRKWVRKGRAFFLKDLTNGLLLLIHRIGENKDKKIDGKGFEL